MQRSLSDLCTTNVFSGGATAWSEWALWIDKSEGAIVENESEVYAGLIVMGMTVGDTYSMQRMGPI